MYRSLLVPLDLSPASARVVGRVARLPLAAGARLTLLHVVPRRLPRDARARAESDAREALDRHAASLSRALPARAAVDRVVKTGAAAAVIARRAAAVKAELVCVGGGGGRSLRDIFLGSTAVRVIREARLPVLVVKQPARAVYARPALAIDLDDAAADAVAALLGVLPPPRPPVAVIHVFDTPMRGLVYPSVGTDEAAAYRDHFRRKARADVARLLAEAARQAGVAPADVPAWKKHVRYGSARLSIEATVKKTGADLLALGTHGYSGVAHAFLGSVAGDVLRRVPCDVLVVPPREGASQTG